MFALYARGPGSSCSARDLASTPALWESAQEVQTLGLFSEKVGSSKTTIKNWPLSRLCVLWDVIPPAQEPRCWAGSTWEEALGTRRGPAGETKSGRSNPCSGKQVKNPVKPCKTLLDAEQPALGRVRCGGARSPIVWKEEFWCNYTLQPLPHFPPFHLRAGPHVQMWSWKWNTSGRPKMTTDFFICYFWYTTKALYLANWTYGLSLASFLFFLFFFPLLAKLHFSMCHRPIPTFDLSSPPRPCVCCNLLHM